MADDPAKTLWNMAQRVGMQIAGLSIDKSDAAYEKVERVVREEARRRGIADERIDEFGHLQMQVIRETVEKIDASGSPQGAIRNTKKGCSDGPF